MVFFHLIGVAALLLATFGANALAAPSGVAGTVTFDRSWTNLDNTIKVTVTDDDENVATLRVQSSGVAGTAPYTVTAGTPGNFYPANAPIADWAGIDQLDDPAATADKDDAGNTSVDKIAADLGITRAAFFSAVGVSGASTTDQGRLDALNNARTGNGLDINDVLVVPTNTAVDASVIGIAPRSVTITSASGSGAFRLVYFGSLADEVDVKVRSTSDQAGFTQTLTESGLNTGVFTGTFTLGSSTSGGALQAANGDVITVSYTDASEEVTRTSTLNVELGPPQVSNLEPASGTNTNDTTVVLTGDLVDAQSGVNSKKIRFYLDVGAGPVEIPNKDKSNITGFSNDKYTLTAITGGVQASVELTLKPDTGVDTDYEWYLEGEDNAGNTGRSDADAKKEGDNAHSITYDKQSVTLKSPDDDKMNAIVGQWWDPTKKGADRLIDNVTKAKNTSIRVIFDGALDGSSVDASDFTVGGATVDAAAWFSGQKDSVFLTVGRTGPKRDSRGGSGQRRHH